jgi:hypothetical protein
MLESAHNQSAYRVCLRPFVVTLSVQMVLALFSSVAQRHDAIIDFSSESMEKAVPCFIEAQCEE